jgi:hypothetical protein
MRASTRQVNTIMNSSLQHLAFLASRVHKGTIQDRIRWLLLNDSRELLGLVPGQMPLTTGDQGSVANCDN